jgi:colanic acid/amylovoran biosynthesis protein
MSHKNILITGVSLQSSSRGIAALGLGTIAAIENACSEVSFTLIAGRSSSTQLSNIYIEIRDHISVKEYMVRGRQYPSLVSKAVLLSILPRILRRYFLNSDQIITSYLKADAVISLSGGDSFSDIYGYKQFLLNYLFDLVAILLKRPLVIFPQTIGPFRKALGRLLAKITLTRAKLVFTREGYSTEMVRKLCGNKANVNEKVDIAFLMQPTACEHQVLIGTCPKVGLNISGFLCFSPLAKNIIKKFDYLQFMNEVIKLFVEKYSVDIALVPHDYEWDLRACEALYESLASPYRERVMILQVPYQAPQLKTIIGEYDFFIGARLHACIAALSMGVPTVSIAYSYKFIGVLKKIGLNEAEVCDPRQDDLATMIEKIQSSFESRMVIRKSIEGNLPEITKTALSCGLILNGLN